MNKYGGCNVTNNISLPETQRVPISQSNNRVYPVNEIDKSDIMGRRISSITNYLAYEETKQPTVISNIILSTPIKSLIIGNSNGNEDKFTSQTNNFASNKIDSNNIPNIESDSENMKLHNIKIKGINKFKSTEKVNLNKTTQLDNYVKSIGNGNYIIGISKLDHSNHISPEVQATKFNKSFKLDNTDFERIKSNSDLVFNTTKKVKIAGGRIAFMDQ